MPNRSGGRGEDVATADSPFVRSEQGGLSERFRELGTVRRFAPGALIYQQGACSDCLYHLLSGRVKIFLDRPGGSHKLLAIMDPGTTFGESACFDGLPYFASAMALRPCEVLVCERATVLAAMARNAELAVEVLRGVIRKQRLLAMQVEAMTFLKAPARIALLLARLSGDYGTPVHGGRGKRLSLRLTHEEIASIVATSRVTVSREIGALIRQGVLAKDKWDIIVLDEARLWQRATPP